eukprot:COSAG01_NODE_3649_length_5825_cov_103.068809_3_plen_109_part_00
MYRYYFYSNTGSIIASTRMSSCTLYMYRYRYLTCYGTVHVRVVYSRTVVPVPVLYSLTMQYLASSEIAHCRLELVHSRYRTLRVYSCCMIVMVGVRQLYYRYYLYSCS